MIWRIAFASTIGTSHEKNGLPCQDACACNLIQAKDGTEILLAIASDGAGSAIKSEIGSKLSVESFIQNFSSIINQEGFQGFAKDDILDWITSIREQISILAEKESLSIRDFACTLVACIIGAEEAIFFQIGDGAIVVAETESQDYGYVFWPQHGEFANQTNFITQDNFKEALQFEVINKRFVQVALFTDGIERLVLDFQTQAVHSPAFNSIFHWLSNIDDNDVSAHCSVISSYLNSDFINNRTDDDKSLIMAVRGK